MYLVINTLEEEQFTIGLADKHGRLLVQSTKKGRFIQAEKLLPAIDKMMTQKYDYKDLQGIIVASGPGGFTSVRIGVVTANTFAYALNLPIVGLRAEQYRDFTDLVKNGLQKIKKEKTKSIIAPFYGREPNITKAKPGKL